MKDIEHTCDWIKPRFKNMKCVVKDLEIMGSNPSLVRLGVRGTSFQVVLEPKFISSEEILYNDDIRLVLLSRSILLLKAVP